LRKFLTFPADLNGDVLRKMQDDGDDLTKARDIEYCFLFESERDAKAFASDVARLALRAVVGPYPAESCWDVIVSKNMLPTHEGITATEQLLGDLASDHDGSSDGWGCLQVDG
jgi:regulator of ribonuclease activity B